MLLKCVAIDDEPVARQLVTAYIEKVPTLQLVQTFEDAHTAVQFIKEHPVELLFLDVGMADIKGIESIRSLQEKPMIIFSTAKRKFEVEGFELEVVDYLIKPFSFEEFRRSVSKAEEYYKFKTSLNSGEAFVYVYSEYKLIRIDLENIEFIESLEDYIRIYLTNDKPVLTHMPLKKIIQKLPSDKFQRIHRSYVVAVDKIRSFTNKKVVLEKAEVPVSDSYVGVIRKLRNP